MAISHSRKVYFQWPILTGNREKIRLVDDTKMAGKLGDNVVDALIGVHAFSNCDAVSSFAGKGKKHPTNS